MKNSKLKQHRRAKRHDKQDWARQVHKELQEAKIFEEEKITTSNGNR